MKIIECTQGDDVWTAARLGIPTASQVDRILTAKTLKPSAQRFKYRNELLAEWLLGYSIDFTGSSGFMERGTEMEPEARRFYEFDRDVEVTTVGFVLRDDEEFGGSPDSLVGDDGGLEIKCPAIHTHIGYMLDPSALVSEYFHQVQSYLYLTERAWWDVLSYNPELPPVIARVHRDPEFIAALEHALVGFIPELNECKERLRHHKEAREREKAELAAAMAVAG